MSIQKFKSLEVAQRALWNFNPDRNYYRSLADLFKLASTYAKPFCEKGVFKFKTIEQANKHRLKNAERHPARAGKEK